MRNLKKISMVIIALLAILIIGGGVVNAAGLTLKATADKKEVAVGEEVTITIDWAEAMGSAEVDLKYDKDMVEYKSATISDNGILNDSENGIVSVIWAALDGNGFSKVSLTFKVKKEGKANFSIESAKGFASIPDMKKPESYDITTYGATAVTLKAANVSTATPTPTTAPTSTPVATQKPTPTPTAKAPTVLPKAGDGVNILVAIPALLAVTVLAYVQIRKYKEI